MKLSYFPHHYSQQRQRQKPVWIYPVLLAMEAEWHRQNGDEVYWEGVHHGATIVTEPEGRDFLSLPFPDRVFSMATSRKYQVYGNYKYHPATHFQVADGCWHGRCTFCVENKKQFKVRSLDSVMEEIQNCERLGFKEMFDDSGTFPDGDWLERFCLRNYCGNMVFGCNMRIGADVDFEMMKRANFRMLLYGIESANQKTLDKINKGVRVEDIIPTLKRAAEAGLEPHVSCMFGLPNEGKEEELKTLNLVHELLKRGYAKTAQASIYSVQGEEKRESKNLNKIYNAAFSPMFWYHKLIDIKTSEDLIYLSKGIMKGIKRD
jgi:anaerobic magnesium-protoporphyrin IX monomethyl ester cyclase